MQDDRIRRVGISGSYGGYNLGDEAILHVIIRELRDAVPVEIVVFSRDGSDTHARHGVDAVTARNLSRREARRLVAGLDLLILGGGGILYDTDADMFLREVVLAHEVGTPVMVYAISAGPLVDLSLRSRVREVLDPVAILTVRDRPTRQLLEEIGLEREVIVSADPALLLEPEPLTLRRSCARRRSIPIRVSSDSRCASPGLQLRICTWSTIIGSSPMPPTS
jgi:polysaccharide pyruvyl transferase WcaK-like protein